MMFFSLGLSTDEVPGVHEPASSFDVLLHPHAMEGIMEAECIRSLNGYRSTIELLNLVPNKEVSQIFSDKFSHFLSQIYCRGECIAVSSSS